MRLVKKNNWGRVFYETDTGDSCPISPGNGVLVEWPDGTETRELVDTQKYNSEVVDMGHTEKFENTLLGFNVSYHGTPVWVEITAVRILMVYEPPKTFPVPKPRVNDVTAETPVVDELGFIISCTCHQPSMGPCKYHR